MTRRAFRLSSILALILSAQLVSAYPGDVFHSAAPVDAPDRPDGIASTDGASVSESGAAHYRIPIVVPPGRVGHQPSLSLSYSSSNPVRGGVAAGWELSIPRIEVDTSQGRLAGTHYRATLSGSRLVRVNEPSGADGAEHYRAELDGDYTRYERIGDHWRALTTDGRILTFGDVSTARDQSSYWAGSEGRWFLTRSRDRFGNEIAYTYEKVFARVWNGEMGHPGADIALVRIEYGANANAGLEHDARIDFEYAPDLDLCLGSQVPIGAQFSYRTGIPLYLGARRLTAISTRVLANSVGSSTTTVGGAAPSWREVRRLELGYDEAELACPTGLLHAPLRLLTSVTTIGIVPGRGGERITAPPITFEYGRRERALDRRVAAPGTMFGRGKQQLDPNKAGGWPTIDMMMIDFDGDGLLDMVKSKTGLGAHPTLCSYELWRNDGQGSFEIIEANLPTVPWANGATRNDGPDPDVLEGCSLAAQFTRREGSSWPEPCALGGAYNSYRFMDLTGDGRLDLVTAIDAKRGSWNPAADALLWPDGDYTLPDDYVEPDCTGACINDHTGERGLCNPFDATFSSTNTDPPTPGGDPWDSCQQFPPECPDPNCTPTYEHPCPCSGEFCNGGGAWAWPIGSEQSPPERSGPEGSSGSSNDWYYDGPDYEFGFTTGDPLLGGSVGGEVERPGAAGVHYHSACAFRPETKCGRYIFRVYENDGQGRFATQPRIVYSPIPLETDRPTSTLGAGHLGPSSSWHGFLDMDGDGQMDAVFQRADFGWNGDVAPTAFQVFRGDGTGRFRARPDGTPYPWPVPALSGQWARIHLRHASEIDHPGGTEPVYAVRQTQTVVTLLDMNGDDLPDYVLSANPFYGPVKVFYNTGAGFENQPEAEGTHQGYDLAGAPFRTLDMNQQVALGLHQNGEIVTGFSRAVRRQVDLDHDGLLDLVELPKPRRPDRNAWFYQSDDVMPMPVKVYMNVGDRLVYMGTPAAAQPWWHGLARIQTTTYDHQWKVMTDFIDVDGDGLEEIYNADGDVDGDGDLDPGWNCSADPYTGEISPMCGERVAPTMLADPQDGQGMRRLSRVRNGLGGEVQFDYAAVSVGSGGRVPHPVWAVTTMTGRGGPRGDGTVSPDLVTSYEYRNPIYLKDHHGQWGFRGFQEVAVTAPSGAHAVTRFDHAQHFGGLPVETSVYDAAGGRLDRVTTRTWKKLSLFGGAIWTWNPEIEVARTCDATQTAAQCRANGARQRRLFEYTAQVSTDSNGVPVGTTPLLWVPYRTVLGEIAVEGTVEADYRRYELPYGPDTYRLNLAGESRWTSVGSTHAQWRNTRHFWGSQGLVKLWSADYTNAQSWVFLGWREYDLQTGNVVKEWRPKQYATGPHTTFTYDERKLFVVATTNELGHVSTQITDRGTGLMLETRGPNQKSCGVGCTAREGSRIAIDALGRPVAKEVFVDDPTLGYRPELVQTWAYHDPTSSSPARVVTRSRIELGGDRWVEDTVLVDGLGRVIETIAENGFDVDAVTSYHHDARGFLVRVDVPHPAANDATRVSYTIERDSHGRVLEALRPDGSGARTTYDGVRRIVEDVVTDGGPAARTILVHDPYGRLLEVHEPLHGGALAITRYGYDGNDNVKRIEDPEGAVTEMTHDWRSRRLGVTRGGRTWSYGYDKDDNLTTIVAPGGDPALYTTSIVYDAIDRPVSRVAGARALTGDQIAELGAASVSFTYDQGENGLGRLAHADTPGVVRAFSYDARGLTTSVTESFALPGVPFGDSRTWRTAYDAMGNVTDLWYGDAEGASPETHVRFTHDQRGRPQAARWMSRVDQPELARLHRTTAGIVDVRSDGLGTIPTAGRPVAYLHRDFDERGRPLRFWVESYLPGSTSLTTRADETYDWHDGGDLRAMTTALSDGPVIAAHTWAFTYDHRHQLTSAMGPFDYVASLTYGPAGKLASANIGGESIGVTARNVTYQYAAADPHAVSALVDSSGQPWASYEYDPAGNVVARARGADVATHVYDGEDHQREVIAADGRREVYFYDEAGARRFILTYAADGLLERLRWSFGGAEITYDAEGAVTRRDAYVSLDGPVARIQGGQSVQLLFHNGLDHLIAAIEERGGLEAGYAYSPFGEVVDRIGASATDFDRTFNGKQRDEVSSLHYYGFRYYDPISMAWTQADPLYRFVPDNVTSSPRRANLYSFTLNNPLRFVDPNGLDSACALTGCDEASETRCGGTGLEGWAAAIEHGAKRSEDALRIASKLPGKAGRLASYVDDVIHLAIAITEGDKKTAVKILAANAVETALMPILGDWGARLATDSDVHDGLMRVKNRDQPVEGVLSAAKREEDLTEQEAHERRLRFDFNYWFQHSGFEHQSEAWKVWGEMKEKEREQRERRERARQRYEDNRERCNQGDYWCNDGMQDPDRPGA